MNLYSFSVLVFSSGVLLISILALVKRKDAVAIRFLLFSICVFGWGFIFSFWITQNYSEEVTLRLVRTASVFVVFIPITWLHFVLTFLEKKEPFKFFYKITYGATFLLSFLSPTDLIFKGTHPILGFKYMPTPGELHYLHLYIFVTLVLYGFYHLIREYLFQFGTRKEQLKYLLAGTISGFVAASSVYLAFYSIKFPLILLIVMPLYPILTGIALIRYGLFDVEQIVNAFRREKLAAIGTLAASINHEIKNPLYIIQGLSEVYFANVDANNYLDQTAEIKQSREVIKKIEEQTKRAMGIMRNFSNFAKQGVGDTVCAQILNLNDVISGILPLVKHELSLRKIKLSVEVPSDLRVSADKVHLEEVFFNLIVNAIQAISVDTPENRAEGEIRIFSERKNGNIFIRVKDNGPGILGDKFDKIFEPFYSTREEGSGLGLYITKRLVEKNGGRLSIHSKFGSGATFEMVFKSV